MKNNTIKLIESIENNLNNNIDYKEAAKRINDWSTEEIVNDLVKNKDCDKRLKDIAENYKKLNAIVNTFNNYSDLEDKFFNLDNEAEKIIAELAGIDLDELG